MSHTTMLVRRFSFRHPRRMKPIAALLCGVLATLTASALEPFRIKVVERGSGWPVPLVELRTRTDGTRDVV